MMDGGLYRAYRLFGAYRVFRFISSDGRHVGC